MKNINLKFKSYIVNKFGKKFSGKIKIASIKSLNLNEVIIKIQYSSINQKDYLVCNGLFWDCRNYPLIAGIDGSGIVVKSKSKKFKKGDKVSIVASHAGSKTPGCFSQYVKIKDYWVSKIPKNLSTKNSMIFGTAGFTAMHIVEKIKKNKNKIKNILVTGASGGVGIISIFVLSKLGYNITAVTRDKKRDAKILLNIGAKTILSHKELLDYDTLPLQKILYDICIENVGGNSINYILKRLSNNGTLYSVGFAKNNSSLNIGLTPFILRRVGIIGIHTESLKNLERIKIWRMISNFIDQYGLNNYLFKQIKMSQISNHLKNFNNKKKNGRVLVKL
tara:strand:+ start:2455 stop:3456 length:1002 start_codon:yes stop_codon:yes gene_type:complete